MIKVELKARNVFKCRLFVNLHPNKAQCHADFAAVYIKIVHITWEKKHLKVEVIRRCQNSLPSRFRFYARRRRRIFKAYLGKRSHQLQHHREFGCFESKTIRSVAPRQEEDDEDTLLSHTLVMVSLWISFGKSKYFPSRWLLLGMERTYIALNRFHWKQKK